MVTLILCQSHVSCMFGLHQIRPSKLSAEHSSCEELLYRPRQSLPTVSLEYIVTVCFFAFQLPQQDQTQS
jgi:hypothetical protein